VGSAVSFTINNAKGRQTKVAFQGGYYLYSYNADGHVERMYTKLDGLGGKTVAYSYDRQGNLTASLYQSGQSDLFRCNPSLKLANSNWKSPQYNSSHHSG
jgi:hypothetical protein